MLLQWKEFHSNKELTFIYYFSGNTDIFQFYIIFHTSRSLLMKDNAWLFYKIHTMEVDGLVAQRARASLVMILILCVP